jgi:hypothetical protein
VRDGYVKLHRRAMDSYLWELPEGQFKVALTCLALANWKDGQGWDGVRPVAIPRGSFMTSRESLAKGARVSEQTVRTALRNLENAGFLTKRSTKRHTVISIVNYESYQSREVQGNQPVNQPLTNGQPAANQPLTTIEEGKKERREEGSLVDAAAPTAASPGVTIPERAWQGADYLRHRVLEQQPGNALRKKPWTDELEAPTNRPGGARWKWANELRLMVAVDGRDWDDIAKTLAWLFDGQPGTGDGAKFVVQSPKSLREKWDRIQLQRTRPSPNGAKPARHWSDRSEPLLGSGYTPGAKPPPLGGSA